MPGTSPGMTSSGRRDEYPEDRIPVDSRRFLIRLHVLFNLKEFAVIRPLAAPCETRSSARKRDSARDVAVNEAALGGSQRFGRDSFRTRSRA